MKVVFNMNILQQKNKHRFTKGKWLIPIFINLTSSFITFNIKFPGYNNYNKQAITISTTYGRNAHFFW